MSDKLVIHIDRDDVQKQQAFAFAYELNKNAHQDSAFLYQFWNQLMAHEDVYQEFVYFMEHGDYLCQAKPGGVSVIDIMIWQMDHFKAELDVDKTEAKQNGDYMVLMAFNTLLTMYDNPEPILKALGSDTGTDYLGKYQSWS